MEDKLPVPKPLLISVLIAVVAISAFFIFKTAVPADSGRTYADPPELAWLKQKSKEVGGDYTKLTPEEKARADKATSGRGAMSVGIYGKNASPGAVAH